MYHLYIITVSRIGEVRGSTPVKLRNVSALVERIYHSPDIFAYGLSRLLHYLWSHKPCLFFFLKYLMIHVIKHFFFYKSTKTIIL